MVNNSYLEKKNLLINQKMNNHYCKSLLYLFSTLNCTISSWPVRGLIHKQFHGFSLLLRWGCTFQSSFIYRSSKKEPRALLFKV